PPLRALAASVSRPDQIEVAAHVEAIPRRDLVFFDRALRVLLVLGVHALVVARGEPACGAAPDHLAAARAAATIVAVHRDGSMIALAIGRIGERARIVIVAGAAAFVAVAIAAAVRVAGAAASEAWELEDRVAAALVAEDEHVFLLAV